MVRRMDIRSWKLRLADGHVRAWVADAAGERGADLDGERFERVAAAAAPLVAEVERRAGGTVRALSLDHGLDVLRASVVRAEGGPGWQQAGAELAEMLPLLRLVGRAIVDELAPRRHDLAGASPSEPGFWEALYLDGGDRWELGRAAPPLERYFTSQPPRGRRALVVGCGRGHEARMLARRGARVVAIDFAASAIAAARALDDGAGVDYRQRDLFVLPADPDRYDLVVEHTCFCAIDPARRPEYVAAVAEVLAPGGELVGLFWAHGREGGPPYSTSAAEIEALFAPRFTVADLGTAQGSVVARAGQELLARFTRR